MGFWNVLLGGHLSDLLISALIVLAVATLARILLLFIDRFVLGLAERTQTDLDGVIIHALRGPIFATVILVGVRAAFRRLDFLPTEWFQLGIEAIYVGFVLVIYYLLFRLIRDVLNWYARDVATRTEMRLDDQFVPFFRRILLILLTAITFIALLDHFGFDITAFVATLGIGSLALALAAQETLSDTISGFIIMIDRPFRLGDRIEFQDSGVIGDVYDIGLRSTRILTLENKMLVVPNSVIGKSTTINHSYPDPRLQLHIPIGVAYGTDIRLMKEAVLDVLKEIPEILADPVPAVHMEGFGNSSLEFKVRCWIKHYPDYFRLLDEILVKINNRFNAVGIEIPFPHRTVYHRFEGPTRDYLTRLAGDRYRQDRPREGLELPLGDG